MKALRPVPDLPPRAVLYLRQSVSRDDSISIELQETAGRDYCASMGYEVLAVEKDEGLSGRNWSRRPAVQRVMDMIESKRADVIVLWKWSRLSRNRKDWALAADRVEVAGGRIESATEPIDTATASGRFARGVMTEYAAFQSEQISEQWKEVFARRARLGLPPTGVMPWGWEMVGGKAAITPERASTIRAMYQLYAEGRGLVYIANWLNDQGLVTKRGKPFQFASVRGCLNSPFHAGYVTHDGKTYPGAHEGVITEAEWQQFLARQNARYVPVRPRKSPYLLSTLIWCHCGKKRVGNVSNCRSRSYTCTSSERHERKTRICAPIDNAIGQWIKSLPATASQPHDGVSRFDRDQLSREITSIEKKLVTLTSHLVSGLVPEPVYRQTRDDLLSEQDRLKGRLAEAELATHRSAAAYLEGREDAIGAWDVATIEEQQSLVRYLIAGVTVMPDNSIQVNPVWGGEPIVLSGN